MRDASCKIRKPTQMLLNEMGMSGCNLEQPGHKCVKASPRQTNGTRQREQIPCDEWTVGVSLDWNVSEKSGGRLTCHFVRNLPRPDSMNVIRTHRQRSRGDLCHCNLSWFHLCWLFGSLCSRVLSSTCVCAPVCVRACSGVARWCTEGEIKNDGKREEVKEMGIEK